MFRGRKENPRYPVEIEGVFGCLVVTTKIWTVKKLVWGP